MNELYTAKSPGQIDGRLHSTTLGAVSKAAAPHVDARPEVGLPKKRRRPPYSYTALIAQAIIVSKNKQLTLREIYDSINDAYPQICQGPDIGWQNTIRHNLSLNQCFKRIPRHQLPPSLSSRLRGKGSYWTVDVDLMDPGTRMRLEEALALGAANRAAQSGSSSESKRARLSPGLQLSAPKSNGTKSGRLSNASSDSSNGVATFLPDAQSYCPSTQSSPYTYYGDEEIQYVSPAAQSSSPYFQSTMNSPIPMHTLPVKHMLPPIPHSHTASAGANQAHNLPSLASALPRPLQGSRSYNRLAQHRGSDRLASSPYAASSNHSHWSGVPDSPPPLDNEPTSLFAYTAPPHYSFGAAVSCARSTARPKSQMYPAVFNSANSSGPTLTPIIASLELQKQSPCSLSPASTIMHLHGTSGNNSESETSCGLVKLTINHLLN
ncbi:hypothetical protein H4218_004601 [Coemansia sp. IMI 209128]|nr:hypothetical protein H4218_004601 [Coemansia sp. IMI 209128]